MRRGAADPVRAYLLMVGAARRCVTYVDARVRIRHPCPYCDLSAAFPEVSMASWCNQANDLLQIAVPEPEQLGPVLAAVREAFGSQLVTCDAGSALTIIRACRWDQFPSVTAVADRCNVWLIPPITYFGGWEMHRILAPSPAAFTEFARGVRKIGEIEVLSSRTRERFDVVRDLGVLPVHLFDGLTEKQIQVLLSACENGLLEVPSRARIGDVARKEGISRSTYSEHLRKAQWRLSRNVYPLLRLRDNSEEHRSRRTLHAPVRTEPRSEPADVATRSPRSPRVLASSREF